MADESSEGKRYSYKKPVKKKQEPQKRRKPETDTPRRRVAKKDVPRRETPAEEMRRRGLDTKAGKVVRDKDRSREMPKSKPNTGQPWRDNVGVTKTTPGDRALNADRRRSWDMMDANRQGDKKHERRPPLVDPLVGRPIQDLSANPPARHPSPMQVPRVGPVEDLEQSAAHRFGYTPEAYKELRTIPAHLGPPRNEWEKGVGGAYTPMSPENPEGEVYINSTFPDRDWQVPVMGHEQGHGMWDRRELDNPEMQSQYLNDIRRWREEFPDSAGARSTSGMDAYLQEGGRPLDDLDRVTEDYANTINESRTPDRSDWPDYMRPYYSGYLQGMDRRQDGEPIAVPPMPGLFTPDAGGNYGFRKGWR
jgi:hypothetical protein